MAVWFITGTSSGFGHELAVAALARGDKVIATARNASKLSELKSLGALTTSLDITASQEEVTKVVNEAEKLAGPIDILVNNAGYILTGAVEEVSDEEAHAQFETNVFGHLKVSRAVLPSMRARRSGVIAFIGSIAGWKGDPACGYYCASKFALVGIVESLREEIAHLGIQATLIELGYFRTNFLTSGAQKQAKNVIDDLKPAIDPVKEFLKKRSLHQPGDPKKGADIVVEALTGSSRCVGRELPNRLMVGTDAVEVVKKVTERHLRELALWEDLASTTDMDDVKA